MLKNSTIISKGKNPAITAAIDPVIIVAKWEGLYSEVEQKNS